MVSVFLLFEHANLHKISLNNKANYPTNFRIPSIYLMKWPYGRDISMYVNNWWMPEHLRPLKCGLALILLISKVGINFLILNLKFTFEEETHSFSKYPINQCVFEQSSHAFDTSGTVISLSLSPKWPLKYSSHLQFIEKEYVLVSWQL